MPVIEKEQLILFDKVKNVLNTNNISIGSNVIIGGDWNLVRDTMYDKSGGLNNPKAKSLDKLNNIMRQYELNDIWRIKNPQRSRYTWRQANPLIQCRLDFWLLSDTLLDNISNTDIIPAIRSDHSAITLHIEDLKSSTTNRPSLWKLNNSLLQNDEYITSLTNELDNWKRETEDMEDKRVVWEYIKYKIRLFSVQFSKSLRKRQNNRESHLQRRLAYMEQNVTNPESFRELEEIKNELKLIDDDRIQGYIVRSRVSWHENGESNTKYFFELEKQQACKKHMRKIKDENGVIQKDPDEIEHVVRTFYQKLYSENDDIVPPNNIFDNIMKLSPDLSEQCEGILSENECKIALESMKLGKSPGNDGLTTDFYRKFWPEIHQTLISSLNYSYDKGELSTSQKQAVITLLSKQGKDRNLLSNWRPISLMNVDYKIASKAIANRLKNVLPNIIHLSQTGFVKNRLMGDTVRVLCDVIDYCEMHSEEATLLLVDFAKAFDSLNWRFLFKTLESMHFGPSFIKWVKTFYSNIESCVINNGRTSKYFRIERGVRQGDPLSPYLFVIAVEVLSLAIRESKSIKGLTFRNEEIKIMQYADDTTAILKDENSCKIFLKLLDEFKRYSGLKINTEKTEAIWLGPKQPTFQLPHNIKWTTAPVKVLGVYIGRDKKANSEKNFKHRIDKIKHLFFRWTQRNLSLTGRILIVKALALSQIIFLANLTPFPDDKISEIESLTYEFIWNGKTDKVKRNVLIQKLEKGGQKMMDIKTMIKCQKMKWVQLYLNNHECLWRSTFEVVSKIKNLNLLLRSNFAFKALPCTTPFYSEVFKILHEIKTPAKDLAPLKTQMVFYNKNILVQNKMVYDKSLFEAGVWYVGDLYEKDSNYIIPFEEWMKRGVTAKSFLTWRSLTKIVKNLNIQIIEPDTAFDKATMFILDSNSDKHDLLCISNKELANILIENKFILPKAHTNLINNYNITEFQLQEIFMLPNRVLKNNKIKEFQYKIVNNYLPTNELLYKMQRVSSPSCSFCHMMRETICHLFVHCNIVYNFLLNLVQYHPVLVNLNVTERNILFGIEGNEDDSNKLLLYIKYFIWKCKLNNQVPELQSYRRYINYHATYDLEIRDVT